MDKEAVITVYQEMMVSINKIKNSGQTLSEGDKIKLAQLESITTELKVKAEQAGFGDRMVENANVEVNHADDLFQLIDASVCSSDICKALKDIVGAKFVDDKLSKKQLWEVIKIFDKFYTANVEKISAVTINSRMKGQWKKIFGQEHFDLQLLATTYQNAAKTALFEEIKKLSPNKWKTSVDNLDKTFQVAFKGKKEWLQSANDVDKAKVQFKIDAFEFPLLPDELTLGSFKLSGGKIQCSATIAATSPVLLANQESFVNGFISDFEQCVRNTVSLKLLKGAVPEVGASTTALTKGTSIPLPFGALTIKTDIGKFDWKKIMKNDESGFTPASVRFQISIDIIQFFNLFEYGPEGTRLNDSKCSFKCSGGFNVSFDLADFIKKQKIAKAKANSGNLDPDKPTWEKDNKKLQKIREQNEDLLKKADKLSDTIAIDKKDKEAIKKAAEEMRDSAKKAHELFDNHDWADKGLKDKASKLLNETGEKIYEKVKKPITKIAKLTKYAKPLAKLIPAVNAVVTVYEVAIYIIDFVDWLNSIDANTWEDYFIAIGESLEDTSFSRWFSDFDRWMKGKN